MSRISTVLLLGGTRLLLRHLRVLLRDSSLKIIVLSSPRHLDSAIDDEGRFRDAVAATGTPIVDLPALTAAALNGLGVDLSHAAAFSVAAPWIIKQDVIDLLGGRIYNCHGARLPQDRGGASTSWQIMRGNRYGFALIHRVDAGIDTGDIVDFQEFLYDDGGTPLEYQRRYERETLALLERVTPAILRGEEPRRLAQPPYLSTYWPRLNTEVHGWIDWSWSGVDLLRFVAAFDEPYDGAHTLLNDRTVCLKGCTFDASDGPFHPFQSGLIYRVSDRYAAVCATTGSLLVTRMFDQRREPLALTALKPGDRLFTPAARLEDARRARVRYTPSGLGDPLK